MALLPDPYALDPSLTEPEPFPAPQPGPPSMSQGDVPGYPGLGVPPIFDYEPEVAPYLPPEPPGVAGQLLSPFAGGVPLRRNAPPGAYFLAGLLQGAGVAQQRKMQQQEITRQEQNRRFESAAAFRNRQNLILSRAQRSERGAALREVRTLAQKERAAKEQMERETIPLTPEEAARRQIPYEPGKRIPIPPRLVPRDERLVQIMGPSGTPIWVPESEARGKPAAQAARAVTGAERQALAYYNRAKDAAASADAFETAVAGMGLAGQAQLQYAPNVLKTSDQRRYRQAQRAFTEARLRKESGAAIPLHEVENDSRVYFAQPGDDPKTLEQKRLARQTVLDGLAYSAGRAYEEYYGEPMVKAGGMVPMVAPDGRLLNVPADKVAEAERRGARRR